MRGEFHPEALAEFRDAGRFYTGCQEGLGLRFHACVESALKRITDDPARFRLFEDDIRRCLVHVFPYAVLYSVEPSFSSLRSCTAADNRTTGAIGTLATKDHLQGIDKRGRWISDKA